MPWLVKDKVLMVHVPRCGGTSITKHHRLPQKSRAGKNPYHKFGMLHYFYRYALLESANFPMVTIENLVALIQVTLGCLIFYFVGSHSPAPYWMWTSATLTFILSSFIFTAPIALRFTPFRRALLVVQSKILCGFGEDRNMLTGNCIKGILVHFTAPRLVKHNLVSEEQINRCAFSIVRNPYSRMVSMYGYNKLIGESFPHFVRSFYDKYKRTYIGKDTTECWDIYCHILPMHCYTHRDSEQIVQTIIKQEQLSKFMKTGWKGVDVPQPIAQALTGIPHANARKRKDPWNNYYDQETMELVLEMYRHDFELFEYNLSIPNRPDLVVPNRFKVASPITKQTSMVQPSDEISLIIHNDDVPVELKPVSAKKSKKKNSEKRKLLSESPTSSDGESKYDESFIPGEGTEERKLSFGTISGEPTYERGLSEV